MTKAIGYIRVSTEEQAKNGLSLRSQEDTIRTYVKLKKLGPVEIISDSESGKSIDREGIQELVSLCEAGEVKHLIVYKLDRLTRKTLDLLGLVEHVFVANGVVFHSVTEGVDTETPLGKFFLTIMGAFAEMERERIVERIKDALKNKKQRGEPLGSPALGFQAKGKKRVENPDELAVVKYLKKLRKKRLSMREIAKKLNEEEVPTKRGGKWSSSTVYYILKSKNYGPNVQKTTNF